MQPWQFATPSARPRDPQVVMLVFRAGAGTPTPDVKTIARAADPGWFDAWRTGALRAIATQDLGDLGALDAADHVHVVTCEPRGVTDLGYLQQAWTRVRGLFDAGATVAFDAIAMAYTTQPPAADAAFDIAREIRVVYETDATHSERAHALHTRGMRKFGAPDLVALCTDDDVELVGMALRELADLVARGQDLAVPRHALEIAPGLRWVAVEDEHQIGQLLQLDNEVRLLVDERGNHLVGVGRRT